MTTEIKGVGFAEAAHAFISRDAENFINDVSEKGRAEGEIYDRNLSLLNSLNLKDEFEKVAKDLIDTRGFKAKVSLSKRPYIDTSIPQQPSLKGNTECKLTLAWQWPTSFNNSHEISAIVRDGFNMTVEYGTQGDRKRSSYEEIESALLDEKSVRDVLVRAFQQPLEVGSNID